LSFSSSKGFSGAGEVSVFGIRKGSGPRDGIKGAAKELGGSGDAVRIGDEECAGVDGIEENGELSGED